MRQALSTKLQASKRCGGDVNVLMPTRLLLPPGAFSVIDSRRRHCTYLVVDGLSSKHVKASFKANKVETVTTPASKTLRGTVLKAGRHQNVGGVSGPGWTPYCTLLFVWRVHEGWLGGVP